MVSACNPKKCPEMRKRMENHKKEHHPRAPAITVKNKAGQSSFNCIEVLKLDPIAPASNKIDEKPNPEARSEIPLKNSETKNILVPKRNFYREHLQDVVLKWFLGIPVLYNTDNAMKLKRLKMVHDLANKIANMSSDVNNADYDKKVKHEIDDCLENLAVWCVEVKMDKDEFNGNLCRSLRERIEMVNTKWLNTKSELKPTDDDQKLQLKGSTLNMSTFSNDTVSAVENEIRDWVETEFGLKSDTQSNIDKHAIAAVFIKRLMPFIRSKRIEKNCFKVEVISTLDEMSTSLDLIKDKALHAHTLAVNLANRVVSLNNKNNHVIMIQAKKLHDEKLEDENRTVDITRVPSDESEDTIIQITDILLDGTDSETKIKDPNVSENTSDVEKTSDDEEMCSKKTVVTYIRQPLSQNSSFDFAQHYLSDSLIVLTSENEILGPFDKNEVLTSTPHMTGPQKEIPNINPAEKAYLDKIVELLRTWLDTTDMTFETTEEQFFKESIANDIAGDLKDLGKQIQMGQIQDRITIEQYEGLLNYVILRAIHKYGLLNEPVTFTTPQVADLREKMKELGMGLETDLTNPQHGDRQKWANFRFRLKNPVREDRMPQRYQPTALDILEDNISVWMNEQPSEIYKDHDRKLRNEQLRELATKVQKKIENKKEEEVKKELVKWLKKILASKAKKDIDNLAADLKKRIIDLPTDEYLTEKMKKKNRARLGDDTDLPPPQLSVNEGTDEQLKDFIEKFMEHNYDVDDSLVKSALGNILLQELLKLSPFLRTDGSNIAAHEEFNPDKFRMELEYIKEVSDWLKNIPFYPLVGMGNERVEFVNGIAKNIAEIEEERLRNPNKMDYDKILYSEIYEYMVQLPLRSQDMANMSTCINQLVQRIVRRRPSPYSLITNQDPIKSKQDEQDFAQFIEEFVNIRGKDIGDDKLKLEAYLARLLKEIQRMIIEKADSDALTKSELYNRLVEVPVPGKESVKRFSIGLGYVQEIAEWLHNFPLIPLMNQEENILRIRMISELAEKMAEYDLKIADDPGDLQANAELDEYITKWIDYLNLDRSKEISVPILISQLKRRMENVKIRSEQKRNPNPEVVKDVRADKSVKRKSGVTCKDCCDSSKECCKSKASKKEDPGDLIVEAIEGWCNDLPIKEKDNEATKAAKEKIATDIFQKVGLLNSDPQAANDDMLYRDMLADEVEAELQQITEGHPDISQIKDKLKDSLLDTVMDTKEVIKDISAGENYKQALENSIDSSLPNPVHISPQSDPGFELYKHRMAMLWLLENYDYAVDFNSLKYKKKLNEDIELYADEAQKRNVLPLEKYEMFNEAFSAMYKQNPPHESSIIEEVENVKIRCEIDAWFKELPLQKASGYQELLEREQILTLLSKKLFDIEKNKSPDSDEKMRKEILKWLHKLPLLPDENKNINHYVDKLVCNLKATADVRKCKRKSVSNKDLIIKEFVEDAKDNQSNIEKDRTQLHLPQATRKENTMPRKKAGDLITAAIETWCNQLPLIAHDPGDQAIINAIRDETILKMYQLLSDLHTDPNILNSEVLYDHHLNIEIERLLSELPAYHEAQQMRNARRARLINELKAARPLIKDEFDREGYKQDLKHALSSFFDETTKPNKITVNDNAKQAIIDNFIQLNYHKGELEEQQLCKSKIDDTVAEVYKTNKNNTDVDPLLTRNQLICEMSKVRPPNESALTDEVREIRMKEQGLCYSKI
ncbi:LOW QUALITY PROTEIN: uncharacterized protein [Choristoneura fumiferana]|uniref:LOW QUALITY PROTEIN: uncharacterized protein n=1 Tax=Choristoneura fumiferana TaxID=7141 RepID=UPI003D15E2CD